MQSIYNHFALIWAIHRDRSHMSDCVKRKNEFETFIAINLDHLIALKVETDPGHRRAKNRSWKVRSWGIQIIVVVFRVAPTSVHLATRRALIRRDCWLDSPMRLNFFYLYFNSLFSNFLSKIPPELKFLPIIPKIIFNFIPNSFFLKNSIKLK